MKPTKLLTAALIGGSLLAAAPAFADPGYGRHADRYERHDRYDRHDRHDRRVVVRRPVVVYQQPARVYYAPAPRPAPVAYYGYASPAGAGTVAGALAGAVIGSQLGHGPDRVAGAAFGSVLGAVIGSQLDYGRY
jgi:Glycine zipper 2TM domain